MKNGNRVTEAQARKLLNEAIRKAGTKAAFAKTHGMTRQFLGDVVSGKRDLSDKILKTIGLTKIVQIQKKGKS